MVGLVVGTITRFEDIKAWQDARRLANLVYRACQQPPLARDFGLKDQLTRSAVSVMANIAEGFGRNRNSEFQHYLRIACGSCAEVASHLYIALDVELLERSDFELICKQAETTGRRITALSNYLKTVGNYRETSLRELPDEYATNK